jgi:hypothetical protein
LVTTSGVQRNKDCGVQKNMSQSSGKIYIPPYSGVRLLECRDHIQLAPVPAVRVFYGYGKIKASKATVESEDGKAEPIWDDLDPNEDVWVVVQWSRFEDGHEEEGSIRYLRSPTTEEDARKRMEEMKSFYSKTREQLLDMTQCFEATDDVISPSALWLAWAAAGCRQNRLLPDNNGCTAGRLVQSSNRL